MQFSTYHMENLRNWVIHEDLSPIWKVFGKIFIVPIKFQPGLAIKLRKRKKERMAKI